MDNVPVEVLVLAAKTYALKEGLWTGEGVGIVLHGQHEASADNLPVMRVVRSLSEHTAVHSSIDRRLDGHTVFSTSTTDACHIAS